MSLTFIGRSEALQNGGLSGAAQKLGVPAVDVWTVFSVETAGAGFLPSRRPPILYERHIFSRLTHGKFDDGDISSPKQGGYGPLGEHQYSRLEKAAALDANAAQMSCSWGLGQVLGENYAMVGFTDINAMVAAMCDSEDAQLLAFADFLKATRMDVALRTRNWAAFARGYNGLDFEQNGYDKKLAEAWQRLSTEGIPNLSVRAAQLYLTFAGFDPGPLDGSAGSRTRQALEAFQSQHGLPQTGVADAATMQALQPAPPSA
jgi:hypothetical protein